MLKLTVVAPCGTVTDGGTVADALLLDKVTTTLALQLPRSASPYPWTNFPRLRSPGSRLLRRALQGDWN